LTLGEPAPTGFSLLVQDLKYFALSRNLFCTEYPIESAGRPNAFSIWAA
jgi:hypothetical protein